MARSLPVGPCRRRRRTASCSRSSRSTSRGTLRAHAAPHVPSSAHRAPHASASAHGAPRASSYAHIAPRSVIHVWCTALRSSRCASYHCVSACLPSKPLHRPAFRPLLNPPLFIPLPLSSPLPSPPPLLPPPSSPLRPPPSAGRAPASPYVMTLILGSPAKQFVVLADLSTSVTWVSCDCISCPSAANSVDVLGIVRSLPAPFRHASCALHIARCEGLPALHSSHQASMHTCALCARSPSRATAACARRAPPSVYLSTTPLSTHPHPWQNRTMLNTKRSLTAKPIACNSSVCAQSATFSCNAQQPLLTDRPDVCEFNTSMGAGDVFSDVVTVPLINLDLPPGEHDSINSSINFGCNRVEDPVMENFGPDGSVGLGAGPFSFASQLHATSLLNASAAPRPNAFSLCLDGPHQEGLLIVGATPDPPSGLITTPFRVAVNSSRYLLNVTGIRLGGSEVNGTQGIGGMVNSSFGGFSLDTARGFISLRRAAYESLVTAVRCS
ncbi:unnamed protein product [Closterium sp. NIES-54]